MSTTDRRETLLATLTDGIAALTSSERWQQWLTAQSRFHHYSFNNTLLIALQDPDATRVAGFHTWKSLGRSVRKGEKGLWIMAPMTRRAESTDEAAEAPTETPKPRILTGFKAVPVFDIRQTDGEPLPEICSRLTGDEPGVYTSLIAVAHSVGYTVEDEYLAGGVNGDCTFDLHRIRVEARNDPRQQVKTLAHELAHALLHEGFDDRALAELEAESVAFVVCNALGIDSGDYSFGYVVGWSGGSDEAMAAIKASGARIQSTADRILAGVETAAEQVAA